MDDRFTGYDVRGVLDASLDGGKMLLCIDLDDPGTIRTVEACSRAVDELAGHQVIAMAASTLPALTLGGEVSEDPDAALAGWAKALALPTVRGLVIGRSLLYPPGDDVAAAVDNAVGLL